jgi:hypothetical protein
MQATFENSVAVLTKAYFNDTLQNCRCHSCAVGNLVASGIGVTVERAPDNGFLTWSSEIPYWSYFTDPSAGYYTSPFNLEAATLQVAATGYTPQELVRIEIAFETAYLKVSVRSSPQEMLYLGLMAVVDVLAEIHGVDLTTQQATKTTFTPAYQARLVKQA